MNAEQERCIYTHLDNSIHEFVFTESSRDAVDEFADHIKNVHETTPLDAPTNCYLVDNSRVELVPITYVLRRLKDLEAYRPEGRDPSRVAVVADGFMGHLANNLLAIALKNRFRFFKPEDRENAMSWLLKNE